MQDVSHKMYVILKLSTCIHIPFAARDHHTSKALGFSWTGRNPPFAGEMQFKYTFKMKGKQEKYINLSIKGAYV